MREIIEKLEFRLWEKGETVFRKKERADNAYLLVYGELNFFDEIPIEEVSKQGINNRILSNVEKQHNAIIQKQLK